MKTLKLGLIPSPDLPADLISKIVDDLPSFLSDTIDSSISWEPEIVIDPLIGSAEYMNELVDKSIQIKDKNNWDFVICVTDLPHFMDKHVIVADVDKLEKIALMSIPSFGFLPIKKRIKQTIYDIMKNMYDKDIDGSNSVQVSRSTYRKSQDGEKRSWMDPIKQINLDEVNKEELILIHKKNSEAASNKENYTQENTENDQSTRFIIKYKLLGYLRILAGMTFSNRPWTALKSFKTVLVIAFGTGIYITIFPTPWELSTIYSIPRFISLMFIAIIAMITWIIFAHKLWEKPSHKADFRIRTLYNYTTIATLAVIVVINYAALFIIFVVAIGLFVPPSLFEAITDVEDALTPQYYLQLAWLSTSLGILAGSIGTTGEDEETIRQITYSYRQTNRYYDIQDKKENTEDQSEKTFKESTESITDENVESNKS